MKETRIALCPSFLLALGYRDIPLDDLEILDAKSDEIRDALFVSKSDKHGINGCVLISTCSRFEIYIDTENPDSSANHILKVIEKFQGSPPIGSKFALTLTQFDTFFELHQGSNSMIVGEVEVAGQVKRALSQSRELEQTSPKLEALFQKSAEVAKKVISETGLGKAGRSFITGGLDILKNRTFIIEGKRVLVVGTGAYARVVISAFKA